MLEILVASLLVLIPTFLFLLPHIFKLSGRVLGWHLQRRTQPRKELLLARVATERRIWEEDLLTASTTVDDEWEKIDRSQSQSILKRESLENEEASWNGLIGFFHPFCNAGGGGERVLWGAIRATQERWPNAVCVVYTGDHESSKEEILQRAQDRFNIKLYWPNIVILYLSTRHLVLSSTWPHFTLLGQSLGSLVLGYDAFSMIVPDIFIDTMGYAFALWLSKVLFPDIPTGAYVHYPTISTDMLESLDSDAGSTQGLNASLGKGWRGSAKKTYWKAFSRLYGRMGGSVDVVMTNSTWTKNHIQQLWGPYRSKTKGKHPAEVVFPPCPVEELEQAIDVSPESETKREPNLIYIAQFRPEKNHQLILEAFSKYMHDEHYKKPSGAKAPHLLLVGSVRDSTDETHVYSLRILAQELHITDHVTFLLNVPWPTILSNLSTASVGVNGMWNEHFGIGNVEYQAAGLISVLNNSGGPKYDIVIDSGDGPTGFLASSAEDYASGFEKALGLSNEETIAMRIRARKSSKRFSDANFDQGWNNKMSILVDIWTKNGKDKDV